MLALWIHCCLGAGCMRYVRNLYIRSYALSTARPIAAEPATFPSAAFGMPLAISCPLGSNPPPAYSWIRYSDVDMGSRLPWPDNLAFIEDDTNKTWATDHWTSDYNGFYVCCAENLLATTCYHNANQLRLFADRK